MNRHDFKWVVLDNEAAGEITEVAQVPGGWLIKVTAWNQTHPQASVALQFIPKKKDEK